MTDIATLGLAVDSGPVKQATEELAKFHAASKGAEQGAQRVEQSFGKASETAKRLGASLASSARSAGSIDARMGIGGGSNTASRMADIEAYGQSLDDLRAKYSPLYAVERAHKQQVVDITKANMVGALSTEEMATAIALSETQFRHQASAIKQSHTAIMGVGKQAALSSYAMSNLAFQVNDVATMAAMGMSPLKILASQAGQFYQILALGEGGVRGSLGYLGGLLKGLITPFRMAVAGAMGLGAAGLYVLGSWRSAQRDISVALMGVGSAAGVTVEDINRIAKSAGASGKYTVGQAREMALALASTGKIGAELAETLLGLTKGTAKIFGEDEAEAATRLANAFKDPAKGVDELNARLGVFDAATRSNIRNLAAQNDRIGAQNALLTAASAPLQRAASEVGIIEKLWLSISTTVSGYVASLGEIANRSLGGGTLEQQLADSQKRLADAKKMSFLGIGASTDFINEQAAQVARLTERIDALNKAAAEAPLNLKSIAFSDAIRAAMPDIKALEDARNALIALQTTAADPAMAGRISALDLSQSERAVQLRQQEVASLEMKMAHQRTSSEIAQQENAFALQGIAAQTAAQRAQIAYARTLAQEQRSGNVAAEIVASAAAAQILAEENRRVGDEVRNRNFAAQQAIELAQLELQLVGKTADEAARITAEFQARQQVQAQAFQSFRTPGADELIQAEEKARRRAEIESQTRRKQLTSDMQFEREQLSRTASEREVYSRMQSAGLLSDGKIVGAQNEAIAGQMRLNGELQRSIDIQREFASSFLKDIMSGKSALESLGGALDMLAQKMLDNSLNALFAGLGSTGGVAGTGGGIFGGSILPGILHNGGIAGNDNYPRRSVPALAFAGAPRYHNGGVAGLKPDEVPAILQKGERVLSRSQTAGMGSGGQSLDVRVSLDSDMLRAVVVDESGKQVAAASGTLRAEMKKQSVAGVRLARDRRLG